MSELAVTGFGAGVALVALGSARWLWQRVQHVRPMETRWVLYSTGAGVAAAVVAQYALRELLGMMGLSIRADEVGDHRALVATFVFYAPLTEGFKAIAIWPLLAAGKLHSARHAMTYAVCAGAGYASAEAFGIIATASLPWLGALRALISVTAHLFFAGAWGFALRARGGRWFAVTWLGAMLLHGVYAHVVLSRGPALLVVAVPALLLMVLGGWLALRSLAPDSDSEPEFFAPLLVEAPSFHEMQEALFGPKRHSMLRWLPLGMLVTIGVAIVCLTGAIFVGHRIGIDFSAAREADIRSNGPLALLGAGLLLAFPVAGYLIARASDARSVLEPALSASSAMVAIGLLLSLMAPVAIVFLLIVAPVAFVLACVGAWGAVRRRARSG